MSTAPTNSLTPTQESQASKRAARNATLPSPSSNGSKEPPVKAVDFSTAFATGTEVNVAFETRIYNEEYEMKIISANNKDFIVKPYPMAKSKRVTQLLSAIPNILAVHALSKTENGYDLEKTTVLFNKILNRNGNDAERPYLDKEYVGYTLATVNATYASKSDAGEEFEEEEGESEEERRTRIIANARVRREREKIIETEEAMCELVYLCTYRDHPENTPDVVAEYLDLPLFLDFLNAFFLVNPGMRQRF